MERQQGTGDREQGPGNGECRLRKGHHIAERLLDLAAAVIKVIVALPRDPVGRHIATQLGRCVSSPGANYAEARAAESRADFVHKVSIAAKEMREASYWLALVERTGWLRTPMAPLVREAEQLTAILASSARTARAGQSREPRR